MRLAIPIHLGRISPLYDLAEHALLLELEDDEERWRTEISLNPPQGSRRGDLLEQARIDHVVCGAISASEMKDLLDLGILVLSMVAGTCGEIIRSLTLGGQLDDRFGRPGCGDRPQGQGSSGGRRSPTLYWGWRRPGGVLSPSPVRLSAVRPRSLCFGGKMGGKWIEPLERDHESHLRRLPGLVRPIGADVPRSCRNTVVRCRRTQASQDVSGVATRIGLHRMETRITRGEQR